MRSIAIIMAVAALPALFADTLTLKDGKRVVGSYLGGTSRQIRMEVADRVESYDVNDVASLRFDGSAPAAAAPAAAPPAAPAPPVKDEPRVFRPAPAASTAPAKQIIEIPAGTAFTVRMIDAVDSEVAQVGQTFQASIDEPVVSGGETVIPRGADAVVKLVEDKQSGKISGRTELTLALQQVKVDGRMIDVTTEEFTQASDSRTGRSTKVIGGTAALGAVIGAIAGGGRGAAIGAVSGAGAGTAVQVLTKGQRVKIPSETRLTFNLQNAVRI